MSRIRTGWPAVTKPRWRPGSPDWRPAPNAGARVPARSVPVLGITGTGGSDKSSLTDELLRRFRIDHEDKLRIAVLAIDPSRRQGRGVARRPDPDELDRDIVFFRSLATRRAEPRSRPASPT